MICDLIGAIAGILVIYALVAYIRRNIAKPDYSDKIVWITGASSGIGQYMAYEFNKLGAYVILSARNQKELKRVKSSCTDPQRAEVLKMDMTDYEGVRTITDKLIKRLEKDGKKLDIVVENAGLSMRCEFKDMAFQNHQNIFDINVHGPYNHIKSILPHLIKHNSGQIVGVSSAAGKLSSAYRSSYAGSKHAFIGIMDSLRTEFAPYGIGVCNIMPGYIRTNLSINAMAAGVNEKFGVTDQNIEKGMDPTKFAKQAVGAIYNRENQVLISEGWLIAIGIVIRNLCPDLSFRVLLHNAKNQSKAIAEGKKKA